MLRLIPIAAVAAFVSVGAAAGETSDAEMQQMTLSVLQGLGVSAPAEPEAEPQDLATLVEQALKEGQSDDYLAALVEEAAQDGRLTVPDAMVATDGKVDTKTLISSLVAKSLDTDLESETEAALAAEARGGARTFAKTSPVEAKPRSYKVRPGDSLAGIALAFYRDASQYTVIFDANRDIIDRPDLIRVGQVILVP